MNSTEEASSEVRDLNSTEEVSSDVRDMNSTEEVSSEVKDINSTEEASSEVRDMNTGSTEEVSNEVRDMNSTEEASSEVRDLNSTEEASSEVKDMNSTEEASSEVKDMNSTEEVSSEVKDMNSTEEVSSEVKDINSTEEASSGGRDINSTEEASSPGRDINSTEEASSEENFGLNSAEKELSELMMHGKNRPEEASNEAIEHVNSAEQEPNDGMDHKNRREQVSNEAINHENSTEQTSNKEMHHNDSPELAINNAPDLKHPIEGASKGNMETKDNIHLEDEGQMETEDLTLVTNYTQGKNRKPSDEPLRLCIDLPQQANVIESNSKTNDSHKEKKASSRTDRSPDCKSDIIDGHILPKENVDTQVSPDVTGKRADTGEIGCTGDNEGVDMGEIGSTGDNEGADTGEIGCTGDNEGASKDAEHVSDGVDKNQNNKHYQLKEALHSADNNNPCSEDSSKGANRSKSSVNTNADEGGLTQKMETVGAGSNHEGTEKMPPNTGSTAHPPNQQQPPSGTGGEPTCGYLKTTWYQVWVLILTFFVYVSYHLSRKPLSVVKNSLHQNCSSLVVNDGNQDVTTTHAPNDTTWCDWAPFETTNYEHLFGWLDVGFLGTYAACMFVSGYVAERMNLRYFLTVGMLCTGVSVAMFGVGYFIQMHNFYFYLFMQVIAGAFQSTGWPAVVATVGNWFGPGRRGAIMGLWNSHTSVGNILGAVIGGLWADGPWGWSFVVPGIIIGSLGVIVFFFLVPYPEDVGVEVHNTRGDSDKEHHETHQGSTNSYSGEEAPLLGGGADDEHEAVSIARALRLPGVVEFSLCLFFAKLVSYTFLFWLPKYIGATTDFTPEKAADLSTLFDVGGVVGGFVAGSVTDYNLSPASNCVVLLFLGTPMLFIYQAFGNVSYAGSIVLLLVCGALVNGPYALITTAVSADLGTQPALKGNKKALATVTSIIDGTGSIGAALGPLLTGWISPTGWSNVFYMLISANALAAVFLVRIVIKEVCDMRCCRMASGDVLIEEQVIPEEVAVPSHHLSRHTGPPKNKT